MRDTAKKEYKLFYHGKPVLTRSGAHMTIFAYSKIGAIREAYAYNILADRAEVLA